MALFAELEVAGGDDQLGRSPRPAGTGRQHEASDVGGGRAGQVQPVVAHPAGNERADDVHVPSAVAVVSPRSAIK